MILKRAARKKRKRKKGSFSETGKGGKGKKGNRTTKSSSLLAKRERNIQLVPLPNSQPFGERRQQPIIKQPGAAKEKGGGKNYILCRRKDRGERQ